METEKKKKKEKEMEKKKEKEKEMEKERQAKKKRRNKSKGIGAFKMETNRELMIRVMEMGTDSVEDERKSEEKREKKNNMSLVLMDLEKKSKKKNREAVEVEMKREEPKMEKKSEGFTRYDSYAEMIGLGKKPLIRIQDGNYIQLNRSISRTLEEYWLQVNTSGGFDIDRCPPYHECNIVPVDLEDEDTGEEFRKQEFLRLCRFSDLAIAEFNEDNATSFKFKNYVKANYSLCQGTKYYITFEAQQDSDDAPTTFQTLVWEDIPRLEGTELIEVAHVILVRMKSAASLKDNPTLLGYCR